MYTVKDSVQYILDSGSLLPKVMALRALGAIQTPLWPLAVNSLLETQNHDGGFPHWDKPGTRSTIGTTSWTLLYLGDLDQAKSVIEKAVEYTLRTPREADGGWSSANVPDLPKDKSSAHLTSLVLSALIRCGKRAHPVVEEGISVIRRCCNPDGSWNRWVEGSRDSFDFDYMVRALDLYGAESDEETIQHTARYIVSHRNMWAQDYFACSALLPCLLMAHYSPDHETVCEMRDILSRACEPNGSWVYPQEGQDAWLTAYILESLLQSGCSA